MQHYSIIGKGVTIHIKAHKISISENNPAVIELRQLREEKYEIVAAFNATEIIGVVQQDAVEAD